MCVCIPKGKNRKYKHKISNILCTHLIDDIRNYYILSWKNVYLRKYYLLTWKDQWNGLLIHFWPNIRNKGFLEFSWGTLARNGLRKSLYFSKLINYEQRCQEVAGSIHAGSLATSRDISSLWGSKWPSGRNFSNAKWLKLHTWGSLLRNDPKLA